MVRMSGMQNLISRSRSAFELSIIPIPRVGAIAFRDLQERLIRSATIRICPITKLFLPTKDTHWQASTIFSGLHVSASLGSPLGFRTTQCFGAGSAFSMTRCATQSQSRFISMSRTTTFTRLFQAIWLLVKRTVCFNEQQVPTRHL
jgi:hypothetical protein